jgi:hypothetical protein
MRVRLHHCGALRHLDYLPECGCSWLSGNSYSMWVFRSGRFREMWDTIKKYPENSQSRFRYWRTFLLTILILDCVCQSSCGRFKNTSTTIWFCTNYKRNETERGSSFGESIINYDATSRGQLTTASLKRNKKNNSFMAQAIKKASLRIYLRYWKIKKTISNRRRQNADKVVGNIELEISAIVSVST